MTTTLAPIAATVVAGARVATGLPADYGKATGTIAHISGSWAWVLTDDVLAGRRTVVSIPVTKLEVI